MGLNCLLQECLLDLKIFLYSSITYSLGQGFVARKCNVLVRYNIKATLSAVQGAEPHSCDSAVSVNYFITLHHFIPFSSFCLFYFLQFIPWKFPSPRISICVNLGFFCLLLSLYLVATTALVFNWSPVRIWNLILLKQCNLTSSWPKALATSLERNCM